MMQSDELTLSIDGKAYTGWTEASLTRALDTLAGSFEVTLAARGDGDDADLVVKAGSAVALSIAGETVMSGFIDRVSPSIEREGHSIAISGRDRAADLIDCSAVATPGSWRNTRIEAIAAELAKPFGITVTAEAATGAPLSRFALQQGETVQSAIERMLRFRGLLAVSDAQGNIRLIQPASASASGGGAAVARIATGLPLSASADHDVADRFSDYIVKGSASGDDQVNGKAASAVKATAKDAAVKRYRPLIVIAEDQATIAALTARAKFEASVRAGRAQTATIALQGWRTPAGALWAPNMIVDVALPVIFCEAAMLVSAVTLRKGAGGTVTELTLNPPEAFSQMAVPEERDVSRIGKAKKNGPRQGGRR